MAAIATRRLVRNMLNYPSKKVPLRTAFRRPRGQRHVGLASHWPMLHNRRDEVE